MLNQFLFISVFGAVLAVSIDDLSIAHNKTQAMALTIKSLMTTETDQNGIDSIQCITDDCVKIQKSLGQLVPEQVALVRQAVADYQPTSNEGTNFKNMIEPWLLGIVNKCTGDPTAGCLSDTFTLNKHVYLPFLSHPNVIIAYAQLIKVNKDIPLMEIFTQLPWCLGDSYNVDCGVSYRKGFVWRVDAMCYVSKGNYANCKDYMRQTSSGIAK